MLCGWMKDNNTIQWKRGAITGELSGHYYVFEAKNNEFSVQNTTLFIGENKTSNTVRINDVDPSKSFILSSYMSTTPNDDVEDGSCDIFLFNSTHIKGERYSYENEIMAKIYIVEFGGEEQVQHGIINYNSCISQVSVDISAVDLGKSTIHSTIHGGSIRADQNCSFDVQRSWNKLSFIDSNTISAENSAWDNLAEGHYQIIQWDVADQTGPGRVNFGNILNDILGLHSSEFTVALWINPEDYSSNQGTRGTANCFLSKDNFEIGITPEGRIRLYLKTDVADTYADYGDISSISLNEWIPLVVVYNNSRVSVRIDDLWYNSSDQGLDPWYGSTTIADARKSIFMIGSANDLSSFFTGSLDELIFFDKALSPEEIEDYIMDKRVKIRSSISVESEAGKWVPIESSGTEIDRYLNFECYKRHNLYMGVNKIEFYLSDSIPNLEDPNIEDWIKIATFDEDREYYSYVMSHWDIPDGNWYFIVRAVSNDGNNTYNTYMINNQFISISILNFADSVNFNYYDIEGRINYRSYIRIATNEEFESHISAFDIYINFSNTISKLNIHPLEYSEISSNNGLIDLGLLSNWLQSEMIEPDEYNVNFIITLYLEYRSNFDSYIYNYTLDPIILDIKGPDLTLLYGAPYSLSLGGIYDDYSNYLISMDIISTDNDFSGVKCEYRYNTSESGTKKWIPFGTYFSDNQIVNITFNILNLRDDKINFRFIGIDSLNNTKILENPDFWVIKDINNHLDFIIENPSDNIIYSLTDENTIDFDVIVWPVDNDITKVVLSTEKEYFELNNKRISGDRIYFSDIDNNIYLDESNYNIFGNEFTQIPLDFKLFQEGQLVTSKRIFITVTDKLFDDAIVISNISIDIDKAPQENNAYMSFNTTEATYNNPHNIPYIVNNKLPLVYIFNSKEQLVDTVILKPNCADFSIKVYDNENIEINNNQFILPIPQRPIGEQLASIEGIWINSIDYDFIYFINTEEIYIKILSENNLDGIYDISNPISVEYGISNEILENNQFIGSYNFQALPQDNYTFKGIFYDITGSVSEYYLPHEYLIDYKPPSIYKQFVDFTSINPESGSISFVIDEISGINELYFNQSFEGWWTIDGEFYCYHFNDSMLPEGLMHIKLVSSDSKGFSSSINFVLNFKNL